MKVGEFIFKYKKYVDDEKAEDKLEKLLESAVKTHYVPWATKVTVAQKIAEDANKDENTMRFRMNQPGTYFQFMIAIIVMYTNIEVGDSAEDQLNVFDTLDSAGAMDALVDEIGIDVKKFQTVVDMCVDDEADARRNMVDYIDNEVNKLATIISTTLSADIFQQVKDEEKEPEKVEDSGNAQEGNDVNGGK